MFIDLILAGGLLGVAWLVDREGLQTLGTRFSRTPGESPYYRVAYLMVLVLVLGWLGLITTVGWDSLVQQLGGGPPLATPSGTRKCQLLQQVLHYELDGAEDPPRKLEEALGKGPFACPQGGSFSINEQGYLVCDVHPRLEELGKVSARPKQQRTPSEQDAEQCLHYQQSVFYAINRKPDPIKEMKRHALDCPFGGRYGIDRDGYLSCRVHGRRPEFPPLGRGRP